MDLITIAAIVVVLPSILGIAVTWLWLRERGLHRRSERREREAVQTAVSRAFQIAHLERQAKSDGNRLSELRTENAELTNAFIALQDRIAALQPLADKALAAQQQRIRASQAAAAKRRKAKAAAQ